MLLRRDLTLLPPLGWKAGCGGHPSFHLNFVPIHNLSKEEIFQVISPLVVQLKLQYHYDFF